MLLKLVLKKSVDLLLIAVTLGKLSCGVTRKGFGSGGKNGINRASLHATKLKREFPKWECFLLVVAKMLEFLLYHSPECWFREDSEGTPHRISATIDLVQVGLMYAGRDLSRAGDSSKKLSETLLNPRHSSLSYFSLMLCDPITCIASSVTDILVTVT